jgi:putative PIN family toxin of toxin-antitoxin system
VGPQALIPRLVLDTNVVLSALVFAGGPPDELRRAWQRGTLVPLASAATVRELVRVLGYPKFRLSEEEQAELLADYLPYVEVVDRPKRPPRGLRCRDPDDQMFLELAAAAACDGLVTGDGALLELAAQAPFPIVTPAVAVERLGRDWWQG